uniref:Uncharacterized protein n=1 Tax=Rhizophora mucronata TaxID=61149 RepID=A0A2P2Q0Z9_RHIMU
MLLVFSQSSWTTMNSVLLNYWTTVNYSISFITDCKCHAMR